jgi:hypothetical protein
MKYKIHLTERINETEEIVLDFVVNNISDIRRVVNSCLMEMGYGTLPHRTMSMEMTPIDTHNRAGEY